MQESYREGIASRPGPKPCEGSREAALELKRWTGVSVGWVLSSENGNPGCPWCQTVRRLRGSAQKKRECAADPAESKTLRMQRNRVPSGRARTERPCHCPSAAGQRAGRGTRKGEPFMHGGRESSRCIARISHRTGFLREGGEVQVTESRRDRRLSVAGGRKTACN